MRYTPPLQPARRLDASLPTGLVLLGMGGPDGPDSIAPFLANLFADPRVLPVPAPLRRVVGSLIVRRRLDDVRAKYARLGHGGGSPQLDWTRRQADALAAGLRSCGLSVEAAVAMRYWHPTTREALVGLRDGGARQLLVVPTYPQYSVATTGSSLAELQKTLAELRWDPPRHVLREWPLLPGYVELLARQAAAVLDGWRRAGKRPDRCALVFTAHALPERFVRHGDPYLRQTRATVRSVHARLRQIVAAPDWLAALAAGGAQPLLAFQSKVGPVRWVGPATETTCRDLARAGIAHLAVVPVSFHCEHIETLDELDRELGEVVRAAGVADFARTPALNLDPRWLDSLTARLAWRAFAIDLPRRKEDHA